MEGGRRARTRGEKRRKRGWLRERVTPSIDVTGRWLYWRLRVVRASDMVVR